MSKVIGGKMKKKIMQVRVAEKRIVQRRREEEKFLQSEFLFSRFSLCINLLSSLVITFEFCCATNKYK